MDRQIYGIQTAAKKFRLKFDWNSSGKLFFCSILIGVLAGLIAAIAFSGFQAIQSVVHQGYVATGIEFPVPDDYTHEIGPVPGNAFPKSERQDILPGGLTVPRYWILILLVPAFGGLLCGFIVCSFAPEASGEGVDSIIRAFHLRTGILRNRVAVVKGLTSFLSIGSGGSAGWEGPIMLVGAAIGNAIAHCWRTSVNERRMLLLAGAAGSLGAMFQIPVGGAIYATEILYCSIAMEFAAIVPCTIASFVGYSTFRCFHPNIRTFMLPDTVGINHGTDWFVFLLFVPIIALFGLVFVQVLHECRNRLFRPMRVPDFLKPAIGGLLLGCVALVFPQVLGGGYEWMDRLIDGRLPFLLIGLLILPKMIATALTVSSGGSGGLLVPSLFIGGLIGGTLGHLSQMAFAAAGYPELAPDLTTCVLIGMGSFYAGIGKIPLAASVIVCEIAGVDYSILIPLLVCSIVHIAIQSPSVSLYEEQVLSPVDSEAHFGGFSVDLLRVILVGELCFPTKKPPISIPSEATIPEMMKLISHSSDSLFPVVDDKGGMVGVLLAGDVWALFRSQKKWATVVAENVAQKMDVCVSLDTDLYTALRKCTQYAVSELPVLDRNDPRKVVAIIRKHEIVAAYYERLSSGTWNRPTIDDRPNDS